MPNIRPVSDLRNHFAEITKEAQLSGEPVFLTKNGVGSIVVMSMESYEQNRYESMVYDKLREAELQAAIASQDVGAIRAAAEQAKSGGGTDQLTAAAGEAAQQAYAEALAQGQDTSSAMEAAKQAANAVVSSVGGDAPSAPEPSPEPPAEPAGDAPADEPAGE